MDDIIKENIPSKTTENTLNKSSKIELTKQSQIKSIISKLSQYKESNKSLIFECPEKKCPYIPLLKYYEYTQSISTKCRNGHEYHLSIFEYFEKFLTNISTNKHCQICMKKNNNNEKIIPEYYCVNCALYICKTCQLSHFNFHKVFEISKIDTSCPLHEKTKFSGYCRSCKKDLCIHCLKDHENGKGHHSLVKYMVLIPSKDKINKYKKKVLDELEYIERLKKIFKEVDFCKDEKISNLFEYFFDVMKLKYYFCDIQLQTFDKIKFNICIIKNVTEFFNASNNTFEDIYLPIESNLFEKKLEIYNKFLSLILKYKISLGTEKKNILSYPYLSHFQFNQIYSLNQKKAIRFIYLLKSGKIILCVDTDGLYIYDESTFKELLHIQSEIDIIDLCENDTGLIFLLKKSMIEIIRLEENCTEYYIENKILFKTIDKVNFITCLENGTIIVSRSKRTEGNLDIWMKAKITNEINNNQDKNNKDNKKNNFNAHDRRRNIINIVNNNRRLEIMLRTARHNVNNYYQNDIINNIGNNIGNNININNINNINTNNNNNNNNDDNNEDNEDDDNNNEDNNNNNNNDNNDNNNIIIPPAPVINNNNNGGNNNDNNNNIFNVINTNINNNTENNNNNIIDDNYNILIQEVPGIAGNNNLNQINNIINAINNNNNNNAQNNNININNVNINLNQPRRAQAQRARPRFVHVIRFIRDQLQGLVHNLEQEELVLEDPSLVSTVGIYGSKDPEITHLNKIIKKKCEIISLLDWEGDYFICAEFFILQRDFRSVRIYSKETYEPIPKKSKLKVNYCMKSKNCLLKVNEDLVGVCYKKDGIEFGISLVSFKTREEVTRYELPEFNYIEKIFLDKKSYLFVFCKNYKNEKNDAIKVLNILDKELIESSNYYYEKLFNTYIINNNKKKNKDEKNENEIIENNELNKEYDENNIYQMIKLKNDIFVCLNEDNKINFYKVE